ncbi:MAG: hypothetical protein EPGJADBJ_04990 [Saprospiraceae bacterium]|nr:hypothetical protein [Saprospiraceae bacterium]
MAGSVPESPVLLQQAPIGPAATALVRPGTLAGNALLPASRTASCSQAASACNVGRSNSRRKRPSRTGTRANTTGAASGAPSVASAKGVSEIS